jgi:hypothetical protein
MPDIVILSSCDFYIDSRRISRREMIHDTSPYYHYEMSTNTPDTRYGEQKIARFRTHDLTKELAYVSTPNQAKLKGARK